jgi:hypothetical protein
MGHSLGLLGIIHKVKGGLSMVFVFYLVCSHVHMSVRDSYLNANIMEVLEISHVLNGCVYCSGR